MSDSTADQDRIESDLARTRRRMDNRLDALQERLSPGQIVDDLMGYVRSSEGGDFARTLMESVRGNPMPAALTGIGLAWLMATQSQSQSQSQGSSTVMRSDLAQSRSAASGTWRGREALEHALNNAEATIIRRPAETEAAFNARRVEARAKILGLTREQHDTEETFGKRIEDALSSARQSAAEVWDDLSDRASSATQQVSETFHDVSDRVSQGARAAQQMSSNLMSSVTDNPVLLGAVGVALGALLGALVPQSAQEEAALSDIADSTREATRDMAQTAVDKGGKVAQQVIDAGKESANAQGITGKTIGGLVDDAVSGNLAGSVKQVAQDVANAGDSAIRTQGEDVVSDPSKTGPKLDKS